MNQPPPTSRIQLLLVEDDPVSAAFLSAGASSLPAHVWQADSIAEAEAICRKRPFDLLLLDVNLPDGRGEDLLRTLREHGIDTQALAHTADTDPALHTRLRNAGFIEVLQKPINLPDLYAALRRHLPQPQQPAWDDAAALRALSGQASHVHTMRTLFLSELPEQRTRIVSAVTSANISALRAELHKLSASCGFVGAQRLLDAVHILQSALLDPAALRALEAAIEELLAAPSQ